MKTKINKNDPFVWIIGFPKSGTSWVHNLISFCLNLPYYNYDKPDKLPDQEWVKNATSGNHEWNAPADYQAVTKIHKLPNEINTQNGVVFYVKRDPRDVFISLFYFMKNRSIIKHLGKMKIIKFCGIFGRKTQIKLFIRMWKKHFDSWKNKKIVIIEYEKLQSSDSSYLLKKLQSVGFNVSQNITDLAMKTFSFENMTGGRKKGNEDQKSFFRKGISGEYETFYSKSELNIFEERIKNHSSTKLTNNNINS